VVYLLVTDAVDAGVARGVAALLATGLLAASAAPGGAAGGNLASGVDPA